MHAPGFGVQIGGQRIGIGRFHLGNLPPVQHPRRQFRGLGVVLLGRHVFQNIGPRRIGAGLALFAALNAHLVEQDLAQLLGAADVEGLPGDPGDLGLQPRHLLREGIRHPPERLRIDLHPGHFHLGQHRHKRSFQRFIDGRHLRPVQFGLECQPEPQRHIRILGGIGHSLGNRNLIEGACGFPRAQQRLYRDRIMAQIAFRKAVHAVQVPSGMHGIGQKHRVVEGRDADAVPRHDLPVIFHVLRDLEDRSVLKHRLQRRQHLIERHLIRRQRRPAEQIARAGPMPHRDIAGPPRIGRQRNPHKLGPHLVKAGGFGVEGHMALFADCRDPAVQCRHVRHAFVAGMVKRRMAVVARTGLFMHLIRHRTRRFGDRRRLDLQAVGDALGQGAEFHPAQKIKDRVRVGLAHQKLIRGQIQRHVAIQLHQPLRQADLVGKADQRLAPLGLLDLARPRQQRFQIAIFVDQQRRRLHPDPRRARHVVDAVTAQRLHIDHPFGTDAEFLDHLGAVDGLVLHGVEHDDAIADQLHQILVGRDDRDLPACIPRPAGQGRDDVVGLVAIRLDAGDVEGAGCFARQGELRLQILGQFGAVGLVFGVDVVAEGL